MSIFVETVERIFADHVSVALIEAAERGETPTALMAALDEIGLFDLLVPQSEGGIGATMADAVVMASAARRGSLVYTSDVGDLENLRAFFPAVQVLGV